jgi:hypothetical protein
MDGIISSPSLWYGNMQNTLVRVVRLVYVDVLGSFRALYLKEVVAGSMFFSTILIFIITF